MDQPISLPGQAGIAVTIDALDYVIGDTDGMVVIPRSIAAEVIPWADRLAAIEDNIVRRIQVGGARADVFKDNSRFSHLRHLKQ